MARQAVRKKTKKRAPAAEPESALYAPLKAFLEAQGYAVRAEVKDCDITAVRGEELVVIEMKRRFSLELVVQGLARQRLADSVYLAVPRPNGREWRRRGRGIRLLLRRLELGLLWVAETRAGTRVEIVLHPLPYDRRADRRGRRAVLTEIAGRSTDGNVGGSTRRKLLTAYRENAIFLACCLRRFGPLSPRQLRALGGGAKTLSILSKDVYGWFERVGRGIYRVRASVEGELQAYADLVAELDRRLAASSAPG